MLPASAQLGKYRLLRRVGVGGMAEVYEAELSGPSGFQKRVALKVLLPHCQEEPEIVKAFIDEASIVARLSHPAIIPVFDFGEIDGTHFLAMEYVDGWDLANLLRRRRHLKKRTSVAAAAYIVSELADALHYVHTRDEAIVHRDVTPHNIFISREGHVRLGDFGVAKANARLARTASGQIKGKLAYLAPEQVSGDPIGPRTDVYAAGLVLFELLTGQRHNPGRTDVELLRQAQNPVFRPPSRLCADVAVLDDVVRGALQRHPVQRTRDAALLGAQLRRFLEAHPYGAAELAESVRSDMPAESLPGPAPELIPGDETDFDDEEPTEKALEPGAAAGGAPAGEPALQGVPSSETEALMAPVAAHRRWPWILLSTLLLSGIATGALLTRRAGWWHSASQAVDAMVRADAASRTAATASQPVSGPATQAAAVVPAADARRVATPTPTPRRHPPRRPRHRPREPIAVVALPAPPPPKKAEPAKTAQPRVDRTPARSKLQALAAVARQRGVFPGDEPEHDRLRRAAAEAVERDGGEGELQRLAEWIERFKIDEGFIKRKLRRLEQTVGPAGRSEEERRQLSLDTQQVLKLVLAGQLVEASRRISALLGR